MPSTVTFLVGRLEQPMGMEHATEQTLALLSKQCSVQLVVLFGTRFTSQSFPAESVIWVGAKRHPIGYIQGLLWLWRHRSSLSRSPMVTVGVWVSTLWLLVAPRQSRTVVWEHSLIEEKIRSAHSLKFLHFAAKLLYRRAASVVGVSEPLNETLRSTGVRRDPVFIPNPIGYPDIEKSRILEDLPRRVVIASSFTRTKRVDVAIRAIARRPELQAVIYGSGPLRDELVSLAARLNVCERVSFRGYQPRDEVLRELSRADLLIHTSVGETFGLVFFEAASTGTPVLAADCAVARWLIPTFVPGRLFDGTVAGLESALEAWHAYSPEDVKESARRREQVFSDGSIAESWLRTLHLSAQAHTE